MDYGVANRDGRPSAAEVSKMLRFAGEVGIELLDTAHAYGEAESVLGEHHASSKGFRIVTKTMPLQSSEVTAQDVASISAAFHLSLKRLGCSHVYGLLVHSANILLSPGGNLLWAALQDFKSRGLVGKLGVSVYLPQQLESILEHYQIDLVQLPYNIYDQRFVQAGLLDRMKQLNIEVHARSIFLQGILLMGAEQLPGHFDSIRPHQVLLHEQFQKLGLTPLEGCLLYCLAQKQIDKVIIGCETVVQLKELLQIDGKNISDTNDFLHDFSLDDENIILPSNWVL